MYSDRYVDAQAQAAVDAAQAVGGGVVYFPPGMALGLVAERYWAIR